MKIFFLFILFSLGCFQASEASVHHVRSGATGNGTGVDWDNAYTQLPQKLIRGHTYYIAAGTYPSYSFRDPVSGTSLIRVLRATNEKHGSSKGWRQSYGRGPAVFSAPINFLTGFYVFDGVFGGGGNSDTYGFRVVPSGENEQRHNLMGVPQLGHSMYKVTDVRISHTAMVTPGNSYPGFTGKYSQVCIYSNPRDDRFTAENIIISHNYMANGSSNMIFRNWWNSVIEYNYFDGNWSSPANHGQQISPGGDCENIIIRGNTFKNSTVFVLGIHKTSNRNWQVYNNLVIGGNMTAAFANADSPGPYAEDNVVNCHFHHNTFINANLGGRGAVYVGMVSDYSLRSYAYNNLFYNCRHPRLDNSDGTPDMIIHSHNTFLNCTGNINLGPHSETGVWHPFVDLSAGDYSLARATAHGKTDIPSIFSTDYLGVKRGHDGVWDRGAYEFQSSSPASIGVLLTSKASENYIELVWEPALPQNNLRLEISTAPFVNGSSPERTVIFNSGSSPQVLKINNLEPGKRYFFAVSNGNFHSNNINSETLAAFIDEKVDTANPFIRRDADSLLLASVTTSMKFAWADWKDFGGIAYRVKISDVYSGNAFYQDTITSTSLVFNGVAGRTYKAEVWPLGSLGQELGSLESRIIICAPPPPPPPGKPEME